MSSVASQTINILTIIFTVLAFMSQSIVTFKKKSALGLSWISQSIIVFGTLMWLSFAMFNSHLSAGIVNVILIPMAIYVLYMSYRDNGGFTKLKYFYLVITIIFYLSIMPLFFTSYVQGEKSILNNSIMGLVTMFIGGSSTAFAFFPQTIKTIKTKDVANLSLLMPLFYMIAQGFWISVFTSDLINASTTIDFSTYTFGLITAIIPFIIYAILTFLKLKYGNYKKEN